MNNLHLTHYRPYRQYSPYRSYRRLSLRLSVSLLTESREASCALWETGSPLYLC